MKLWAGRFTKESSDELDSFNSSIAFDFKMYKQDIMGSIVHGTMLEKQGIITKKELDSMVNGLQDILKDIETGKLKIDPQSEDVHMFIEAELTRRIGEDGKRLHTARSRNDQVALDIKLYLKQQCCELEKLIEEWLGTLINLAETHSETIMPGYTHLQRAQPITFGHHIMAYVGMFFRDKQRLKQALHRLMEESPLGSGALAGTTYPIDRQFTAEKLGFLAPYSNSIDGVSDRDYCAEIISVCSIVMMHLSRFAEEIILWCSWEFKFIELDDAFATGSSIMPQKKNPDIAELVRGKTGRVYGDLITILTMMKGLPLAYNKDMQEDKEAVFDAVDTVKECLTAVIPMTATLTVEKENMYNAAAKGFINATDCADYLVKKGMAFRDAYKITGELVGYCISQNAVLENLNLEVYKTHSDLFEKDIFIAVSLETCVSMRTSYGGPGTVKVQVKEARKKLEEEAK